MTNITHWTPPPSGQFVQPTLCEASNREVLELIIRRIDRLYGAPGAAK